MGAYSPGRGICGGIGGSSETGRGKGSLISTFAWGTGRWAMSPPNF